MPTPPQTPPTRPLVTSDPASFHHVNHAWDDAIASRLSPVERLVYRSNLLGSDQRITNTGGGNTSSKISERDPISGSPVDVVWVKGSGGDLRTATKANFASLEMPKLTALKHVYAAMPERGLKSAAEDRMVDLYPHCTFNLNPRASSIDTPLHAFVPARHVDHTHPNAVIAIAASRRSRELTVEVFGEEIGWVPWMRPGFELGLRLEEEIRANPNLKGVVMGQHGLINWADGDRECYELTLSLIERAARFIDAQNPGERAFGGARYESLAPEQRDDLLVEMLPWLRGRLSQPNQRIIATTQCDEPMLRFVNSVDAPRLAEVGTSCPDHFLRTKIKPLYVAWNPQRDSIDTLKGALEAGLAAYRADYAAYYNRCRRADSPPMRDPSPTVILIPGVGMIAWGKNKSESRVTAEFYNCAVEVMAGAEAIDEYIALPQQEAFDIEYWRLEEAKLRRMPAERELARHVAVVVGAGSGIGRAAAYRLAGEGAHVACLDLDERAAESTAAEVTRKVGEGIGVAGTGVSNCGPACSGGVDITRRESVRAAIRRAVLAYGGFDHLIITAGIYVPPGADGSVTDEQWKRTFDVNVMGAYLVADESRAIWKRQNLRGTLVLTTSVNGLVPKRGSLAYDASKAAANHLARELAIELAPLVRVNALAPATVVDGSTMFPRQRVIASLIKYGIAFDQEEPDDALRTKLATFYAERTLTGQPVTTEDQACGILFLVSSQSSRTTGQVLCVDGGLHEAFVR